MQGTFGITGLPGLTFSGIGAFTGIAARSFTQSTNQVSGFTDNFSVFRESIALKPDSSLIEPRFSTIISSGLRDSRSAET